MRLFLVWDMVYFTGSATAGSSDSGVVGIGGEDAVFVWQIVAFALPLSFHRLRGRVGSQPYLLGHAICCRSASTLVNMSGLLRLSIASMDVIKRRKGS